MAGITDPAELHALTLASCRVALGGIVQALPEKKPRSPVGSVRLFLRTVSGQWLCYLGGPWWPNGQQEKAISPNLKAPVLPRVGAYFRAGEFHH